MDGKFTAGVQYDDWFGSAAADIADQGDIHDLLRGRGLLNPGEFVVGIELFSGGPNYKGRAHVGVSVFLVKAANFDEAASVTKKSNFEAKKIDLEIETLEEFFCLFKRFDIKIMKRGLNLDGRDYSPVDYL